MVPDATEADARRELEFRLLARRKAAFHRRRRHAALREWLRALPLVMVSLLVLLVAVFIASHP